MTPLERTRPAAGTSRLIWTTVGNIRGFIVPRPLSLVSNTLIFAGGAIFAWLEGYRGYHPTPNDSSPYWPIFTVLAWFVIQELFVQQAKYMGNDIRDHVRDQQIPANRARPIARSALTKHTRWLCGGRWGLGLLLAAFLSLELLLLTLLITLLQLIYEQWAKPHAAKFPQGPLFIVAAGTVLKFMGGALAMNWTVGDQRLWFYGLAFFGTGVVYISSIWRVEAVYFRQSGRRFLRGQSAHFHEKGWAWFKMGAVIGLDACLLLILDGYVGYLGMSSAGFILVYGAISLTGALVSLLFLALANRVGWVGWLVVPFLVAPGLLTGGSKSLPLMPFPRSAVVAFFFLLVLVGDFLWNLKMDYHQQNLLHLQTNWPKYKKAIFAANRSWPKYLYLGPMLLAINSSRFDAALSKLLARTPAAD